MIGRRERERERERERIFSRSTAIDRLPSSDIPREPRGHECTAHVNLNDRNEIGITIEVIDRATGVARVYHSGQSTRSPWRGNRMHTQTHTHTHTHTHTFALTHTLKKKIQASCMKILESSNQVINTALDIILLSLPLEITSVIVAIIIILIFP